MNDNLPMCFAVCVCGANDFETEHLLPVAIESFHRQTYPANRRMLLLVTEAENAHKLRKFKAPDVKMLAVAGNPTLGELRNVAIRFVCEQAPGGYLIQWDVDGHATGRMAMQMQAALAQPGMAACLMTQLCYSLDTDVAFVRKLRLYGQGHPPEGTPTAIHGTITHPANELRYPSQKTGEDTVFWQKWVNGPGCLEDHNDPRLYIRFSSKASVSGAAHVLQEHIHDAPGTWTLSDDEAAYLRLFLSYYKLSDRSNAVEALVTPSCG